MISLPELQQQLAIDKSVLDDEVIRQPVLFYEISEQLTEAVAERDAAKENLSVVDAELDHSWRKKLAKTQNRVTEGMLTSYVITSPAHEKAFQDYLQAKTKADKLLVLKEAFQQRSYMLRDLVSLYAANYYEDTALKPSKAQDASHYNSNRVRMSIARIAKNK
jgi:hypothetical protein